MRLAITLAEAGKLPDILVRKGIRQLTEQRLKDIYALDCEVSMAHLTQFIADMRASAQIAPVPELANIQHYEVPEAFFAHCLGDRRKYSSCFWLPDTTTLDEAEVLALNQTCDHADLQDWQTILELGCGWGSLSLWMAEKYPKAHITGVSNSHSQREYITAAAKAKGITNLNIITADMNSFEAPAKYDRIVSVEMFANMRNYQVLYGKVSNWLKPKRKFFKHIFVHRSTQYAFDGQDENDWMSH